MFTTTNPVPLIKFNWIIKWVKSSCHLGHHTDSASMWYHWGMDAVFRCCSSASNNKLWLQVAYLVEPLCISSKESRENCCPSSGWYQATGEERNGNYQSERGALQTDWRACSQARLGGLKEAAERLWKARGSSSPHRYYTIEGLPTESEEGNRFNHLVFLTPVRGTSWVQSALWSIVC